MDPSLKFSNFLLAIYLTTLFSTLIFSATTINGQTTIQPSGDTIPTTQTEKLTQLHFYFHDIVSGSKSTVKQIAGPTNFTDSMFGATLIADDALTEGPEPNSKIIGRAQGIYAVAAQEDSGLLMVMSYAFTDGVYNGSSLSILGRNQVNHPVREMPVVGGTGTFRFARGFALAKTFWYNTLGDAIVEYNVTVLHY
ncbi:hypothetical protein Sjap_002225 [Stephania japonica]|uniref:Dirigent protein n=1 Tax=Stephania japonica TaxID=461633 RepID=A0AAP0KMF0_9MAGN